MATKDTPSDASQIQKLTNGQLSSDDMKDCASGYPTVSATRECGSDGGTAKCQSQSSAKQLQSLMSSLDAGDFDTAVRAIDQRRTELAWRDLPSRIILMRHGQSEGNKDPSVYANKGDSQLELTSEGIQQATAAGARMKELLGNDSIYVCCSPFERTKQTLYALFTGGLSKRQIVTMHTDPRIREKEFGNFQTAGLTAQVRVEETLVGRFYYRPPNAESPADVFDRICSFWSSLLDNSPSGLMHPACQKFDTCLLVTHGLTIRLLLMRILNWSVATFETMFNPGNCDHITLRKNAKNGRYELCPTESFPAHMPWATAKVWLVYRDTSENQRNTEELDRKISCLQAMATEDSGLIPEVERAIDVLQSQKLRERSKAYTVLDYLSVPAPRMQQIEEILKRCVEGHHDCRIEKRERLLKDMQENKIDRNDLDFIDWWGDRLSFRAKMLARKSNCMDSPTHEHQNSTNLLYTVSSPCASDHLHRYAARRVSPIELPAINECNGDDDCSVQGAPPSPVGLFHRHAL